MIQEQTNSNNTTIKKNIIEIPIFETLLQSQSFAMRPAYVHCRFLYRIIYLLSTPSLSDRHMSVCTWVDICSYFFFIPVVVVSRFLGHRIFDSSIVEFDNKNEGEKNTHRWSCGPKCSIFFFCCRMNKCCLSVIFRRQNFLSSSRIKQQQAENC